MTTARGSHNALEIGSNYTDGICSHDIEARKIGREKFAGVDKKLFWWVAKQKTYQLCFGIEHELQFALFVADGGGVATEENEKGGQGKERKKEISEGELSFCA